MPPMRLYMLSMVAVQQDKKVPPSTPRYVHMNHGATLAFEESIHAASEKGREVIFEVFPKTDGWSGHSLVVAPVGRLVFDALEHYRELGLFVADPDLSETTQTFHLDPDMPGGDVQSDPSGNVN